MVFGVSSQKCAIYDMHKGSLLSTNQLILYMWDLNLGVSVYLKYVLGTVSYEFTERGLLLYDCIDFCDRDAPSFCFISCLFVCLKNFFNVYLFLRQRDRA